MSSGAKPSELERSAALIERMLGDPELRRRFRADPAEVLRAHGLADLAQGLGQGPKALHTLELRESRSSLAGALVAAAAEGVDFAHFAGHAGPGLAHDAGRLFDRLVHKLSGHHARPAAKPKLTGGGQIPGLAEPAHAAAAATGPGTDTGGTAATDAASSSSAVPAPAASTDQVAPAAGGAPHSPASAQPAAHSGGSGARFSPGGSASHTHPAAHGDHATTGTGAAFSPAHHDLLTYPGDTATPHAIAAWMGAHAKRAGLPPALPVMAALTESNLQNVPYGDRDSVGFFQMRVGIWNTGIYKGYPDHPQIQLRWFIDKALAVKAENPALAADPNRWGEWVANIEQPAAQYRYRYQLQLESARELLRGVELDPPAPAAPVAASSAAVQVALHYLGTPYHWGGSSPASGFDCSGLVQYAYAQEGIQLPRVAADQFHAGVPVPRSDLKPGDAVFFADSTGYVHHVGLYIGDGRFINAPRTGEPVKIDSLSEPYFAEQYAGARRFTAGGIGNPARYARTMPVITK